MWNKLGRDNSTPADISAPLASGEEDIFDSKFISEYSYTKTIAFKYPQVKIQRPFSEFVKKPFDYPYGYKCANMAQTLNESGLDMQRFLEVAPSLWEEIKFSKRYEAIKQRAAEVESQICAIPQGPAHAVSGTRSGGQGDLSPCRKEELCFSAKSNKTESQNSGFVALHLRAGDVVYGNYRLYLVRLLGWVYPVELAFESALKFLQEGKSVVIFSADSKSAKLVQEHCKRQIKGARIHIASEFFDSSDEFEMAFFELVFMSRAAFINGAHSSYSLFAANIGGIKKQYMGVNFSQEEQFRILTTSTLKTHPLQRVASAVYAFNLGRNLKKDFEILDEILQCGIANDKENPTCQILRFSLLLEYKKFEIVESQLEDFIKNKKFLDLFLSNFWGARTYGSEFNLYLQNATESRPFICFIAAKIRALSGEVDEAIRLIKMALESKNLKIFKEFLSELETERSLRIADSRLADAKLSNFKISQKLTGAAERVKNHLNYKLGAAVIAASKERLFYLKLPFILWNLKREHNKAMQEYRQKVAKDSSLKLPPLEFYSDYEAAKKELNCFTYRLGSAFSYADRHKFCGGYLWLLFEINRIKAEFKK
ncbi:MAG: hypothetical protein SOW25_01930 [Helicobacter sp.]|nr:hypothetical protein [Helicobacter sp.]